MTAPSVPHPRARSPQSESPTAASLRAPADPVLAASLTPAELRGFQDLAYREAGLHIGDQKLGLVQNRLRPRLAATGCRDFAAYHHLVSRPDQRAERQRCIEALTTNETFFFRHKAHWDHLCERFVPTWLEANRPGRSLRAWCAAASTGAEPYSLAMLLATALPTGRRWHVEASDINEAVLATAKAGFYESYAVQKVSATAKRAWFTPVGVGRWRIDDRLRSAVRFFHHNLMQPCPGEPVDVIMVRNVLIYFDDRSKHQVLGHLHRRLAVGGLLFLGGSETLPPTSRGYRCIGPAIYQREE